MKNKKRNPVSPPKVQASSIDQNTILTGNSTTFWILAGILSISFIAYLPALRNELLVWDDEPYIKNNPLVHSIQLQSIFTKFVEGNYHPLTILFLALEYQIFGLKPFGYHLVNLLLHLANILLVYKTILLLINQARIAILTALLFGIHPIHVESVAWVAEIKDLLYTFFFLGAYIFYLKYSDYPKRKYYLLSLIFFLMALLSKAMAASFPVLLLMTDYFKAHKVNTKLLLEKLPFFILALVFGVIAIIAQKTIGATDSIQFPFIQQLVFAIHGYANYLWKLLIPLNLSPFYPYPVKAGEEIPLLYYSSIGIIIAITIAVFYSLRYSKKIFFGIGFFTITLFLVLQLFPVGRAMMADRYVYIPSIGFCYLAGEGISYLWNTYNKWIAWILTGIVCVFFLYKTHIQCKIWKDDLTLWNEVIQHYQNIPHAYYNRGLEHMKNKKADLAIRDFNKAIELKAEYVDAYINRGILYTNEKKYDQAIRDYNQVIQQRPGYYLPYYNRGVLYLNLNKYPEALYDLNKTIELKPDYPQAYNNRGNVYYAQKKYAEAILDFSKVLFLKENYPEAYYNRGLCHFYLGNKVEACGDLSKAAGLGYRQAENVIQDICK